MQDSWGITVYSEIYKMYWDLTRSIEIAQDLLILQNTFDIWYLNFYFLHLTFDIDTSFHIWHLLRSHKIYWDLKRSTDLALYIWHLVFDIWHAMTFDIWNLTFDIWHLTFDMPWHDMTWHLTFDRSNKIYWDLTRSTDLTKYIWHLIFELLHLTFDIDMPWHASISK